MQRKKSSSPVGVRLPAAFYLSLDFFAMNLKSFPKRLDSKTSCLRITVPENLDLALEGLIRKVLKEQPKTDDIHSFAANYFETLLKIRDKAGGKYTSSQLCPFHNDEDAHEMIKLANTFSKFPEKTKPTIKSEKLIKGKETSSKEEVIKTERTKPKEKLKKKRKANQTTPTPDLIKKLPKVSGDDLDKKKGETTPKTQTETKKEKSDVAEDRKDTKDENNLETDLIKELVKTELMKENEKKMKTESKEETEVENKNKEKTTPIDVKEEQNKLTQEEKDKNEIKEKRTDMKIETENDIKPLEESNTIKNPETTHEEKVEVENATEQTTITEVKNDKEEKEHKIPGAEEKERKKAATDNVETEKEIKTLQRKLINELTETLQKSTENNKQNENAEKDTTNKEAEEKNKIYKVENKSENKEHETSSEATTNLQETNKEIVKETENERQETSEKESKTEEALLEKEDNQENKIEDKQEQLNETEKPVEPKEEAESQKLIEQLLEETELKQTISDEIDKSETKEDKSLESESLTEKDAPNREKTEEPNERKCSDEVVGMDNSTLNNETETEDKKAGNEEKVTAPTEEEEKRDQKVEVITKTESEEKQNELSGATEKEAETVQKNKETEQKDAENKQKSKENNIKEEVKPSESSTLTDNIPETKQQEEKNKETKIEQNEVNIKSECEQKDEEGNKKTIIDEKPNELSAPTDKDTENQEKSGGDDRKTEVEENPPTDNIIEVKPKEEEDDKKTKTEEKDKQSDKRPETEEDKDSNKEKETEPIDEINNKTTAVEENPEEPEKVTETEQKHNSESADLKTDINTISEQESKATSADDDNIPENDQNQNKTPVQDGDKIESGEELCTVVDIQQIPKSLPEKLDNEPKQELNNKNDNKIDQDSVTTETTTANDEKEPEQGVSKTNITEMPSIQEIINDTDKANEESKKDENSEIKKNDDVEVPLITTVETVEKKAEMQPETTGAEDKAEVEELCTVVDIQQIPIIKTHLSENQKENIDNTTDTKQVEEDKLIMETVQKLEDKEPEEELCTVVDSQHIIRVEEPETTTETTDVSETEVPQLKTIQTHYYDTLRVPETVTKELRVHSVAPPSDATTMADSVAPPSAVTTLGVASVASALPLIKKSIEGITGSDTGARDNLQTGEAPAETPYSLETPQMIPPNNADLPVDTLSKLPLEPDSQRSDSDDFLDLMTPTSGYSLNLSDLSWRTISGVFLDSERQYSSIEKQDNVSQSAEPIYKPEDGTENAEEKPGIVEVFHKTVLPSDINAVPVPPRNVEEIEGETNAQLSEDTKGKNEEKKNDDEKPEEKKEKNMEEKPENKREEEKPEVESFDNSIGGSSSNGKSIDSIDPFISVEVKTVIESQILNDDDEEDDPQVELKVEATVEIQDIKDETKPEPEKEISDGKNGEEISKPDQTLENNNSGENFNAGQTSSNESESTISSAATEIKRSDSNRRNIGSARSLLSSQSLDLGGRNPMLRTRSLSTFRHGVTDFEVWNAIEKELEEAATKIQSRFRSYKTRKKLLQRENAVQITTEESSVSTTPAEVERQQSTGEFHDSIVLSEHPR